eukprot:scaffold8110_cov267-Pinguiococcus_pyrenoidosus.AAC.10
MLSSRGRRMPRRIPLTQADDNVGVAPNCSKLAINSSFGRSLRRPRRPQPNSTALEVSPPPQVLSISPRIARISSVKRFTSATGKLPRLSWRPRALLKASQRSCIASDTTASCRSSCGSSTASAASLSCPVSGEARGFLVGTASGAAEKRLRRFNPPSKLLPSAPRTRRRRSSTRRGSPVQSRRCEVMARHDSRQKRSKSAETLRSKSAKMGCSGTSPSTLATVRKNRLCTARGRLLSTQTPWKRPSTPSPTE